MSAAIILVVCLAGNCREETLALPNEPALTCIVKGQEIAQDWLGDHPKWTLRGWRCRISGGRDS